VVYAIVPKFEVDHYCYKKLVRKTLTRCWTSVSGLIGVMYKVKKCNIEIGVERVTNVCIKAYTGMPS
jgi:hypothetical protein